MKKQTITRKELKEIYPNVCPDWQKTITELLFQDSQEIEVEDSLIQKALSAANDRQKKWINNHFELPKSITDRIDNWTDVEDILGYKAELPYSKAKTKMEKSINALYHLHMLAEAYNQGWVDWSNVNQYKYFPYYDRSDGVVVVNGWVYDHCFPAGVYFETREKAENALKKFRSIFDDFWG